MLPCRPILCFTFLTVCLLAAPATGSRPGPERPHPAILLRKSNRFIALSAWNSVGLYSLKDGELLREFPVREYFFLYGPGTVDPEEQFLVNVNRKGTISLWEIDSGKKLWSNSPFPEETIFLLSFSADGGRLLIRGPRKLLVCEARSGNIIREIDRGYDAGWRGGLTPDGSQVRLTKLQSAETELIDVSTGVVKRLDVGGDTGFRYTTDGKFAAVTYDIGSRPVDPLDLEGLPDWEELRVVSMAEPDEGKQVGIFESGIFVRPVAGGGLLVFGKGVVTVADRSPADTDARVVERSLRNRTKWLLFRYDPATEKVNMMDGPAFPERVGYPGDFDLERMLGVITEYNLVTRVVDLKTWKDILKIDNSRDAHPPYSGRPSEQWPGQPVLFRKSDRFLALKAWDSVGLYGLKDGKLLQQFVTDEETHKLGVVDPQERFLVDWSEWSETIGLWEIDSGKKLWSKRAFPLHRCDSTICCLSFSADGRRLLIVGTDRFIVRDAASGKPIRELDHEYSTQGWRGALSPDGSKVMLSDARKQQSYLIDVSTGEMKRLNVGGGAHVQYSTDGRFVAFFYYPADDKLRGGRVGSAGFRRFLHRRHGLRVVSMDDAHKVREVGLFEYVQRIRALPGGGFLILGKGIVDKDYDSLADTYARLGADCVYNLMKRILFKYDPSADRAEKSTTRREPAQSTASTHRVPPQRARRRA